MGWLEEERRREQGEYVEDKNIAQTIIENIKSNIENREPIEVTSRKKRRRLKRGRYQDLIGRAEYDKEIKDIKDVKDVKNYDSDLTYDGNDYRDDKGNIVMITRILSGNRAYYTSGFRLRILQFMNKIGTAFPILALASLLIMMLLVRIISIGAYWVIDVLMGV